MTDRCSTCEEFYTKVPTLRASVCSNAFHCCRECVWAGGRRVSRCADHGGNLLARRRILVDIDGVFADFITPCLDAVYAVTGRRHTPDEVTEWDIMKALGIDEETGRAIYKSMEVPGLCAGIPAYPGAREGVERLREWAEVWAVTSPFGGEHWMHERDAWLVRNMGFNKLDVLHVRSERKHGVFGHAIVDDKVSTLHEWRGAWPEQLPVLMLRYSNANDGWDGPVARDWPHLVEVLESQLRR